MLLSLTSLSVFVLLFIRKSSQQTKKGRERERRKEKEERRNVLITLKKTSYLPTHIAECPTHTNTHNTHLQRSRMNQEKREKKGGQGLREWEMDRKC